MTPFEGVGLGHGDESKQTQSLTLPSAAPVFSTQPYGELEGEAFTQAKTKVGKTLCHEVGKRKTQKIERKHLRLRTRIKRLTRRTISFSKSELMHDLVVGLFINRYEFGL